MGDEQFAAGVASSEPSAPVLTIEIDGQAHTLRSGDDPLTIGREPPSQLLVPRPGISRAHVRIEQTGGKWSLADAGSRNGVYHAGQRIDHLVVDSDLVVHLGDPDGIELRISAHAAPTAGATDEAVARAGTAVAARSEELGLSALALAGDVMTLEEMTRFEQGEHWPSDDARTALEELLKWPAGAITDIRDGAPVPEDEFTEVLSPTVQVSIAIDAAEITVRAVRARASQLPEPSNQRFAREIKTLLADLRRLDRTVTAAAHSAPGRLEVTVALAAVRQLRTELVVRAAQSPQASLGHRLFAVRHRGGLTAAEVASAAGVTVAEVVAAEADDLSPEPVVRALELLVTVIAGALNGQS